MWLAPLRHMGLADVSSGASGSLLPFSADSATIHSYFKDFWEPIHHCESKIHNLPSKLFQFHRVILPVVVSTNKDIDVNPLWQQLITFSHPLCLLLGLPFTLHRPHILFISSFPHLIPSNTPSSHH